MGIYVFTARFLFEQLCRDATRPRQPARLRQQHHSLDHRHATACSPIPFRDENRKTDAYWRDVGTLDAYYEANMDLISVDPQLNMYDEHWPIRTYQPNLPPPKFVFADPSDRRGTALDSIVCPGSIVSGGQRRAVDRRARRSASTATPRLKTRSSSRSVDIGRHAKIRRAIIDKGVCIPHGIEIGYDHEQDLRRGFTVTEDGITVIAKAQSMEGIFEGADMPLD